jgi:hypothetical protein
VITPLLIPDSREQWQPVPVEESLATHGYQWEDGEWLNDEREPVSTIDLPGTITQPDLPATGYYRTVHAAGLTWHQYWTWWLYNPKNYPPTKRGVGEHEGDWELVQYACCDDTPILATYSQHDGGEARCYWDVELTGGIDGQPVVYVARDSHANYFAPVQTVTDTADGAGTPLLSVRWLSFGAWAEWPGRWGNSTNSPGPLSPRRAWTAPHAWHSQARAG